jgi:hypothetical protein
MLKLASYRHICAAIFILTIHAFAHGQVQDRIVETYAYKKVSAAEAPFLRIIEIKVAGNAVTLGRPFAADHEWLKSLSVRVKNISGKPINILPVSFSISDLGDERIGDVSFTLIRGIYGNGEQRDDASGEQKPIMPDEEIDLTFTEKQLSIIQQMTAQRGITLTRIKFLPVTFVTFADGSKLKSGFSYTK